jgi:hypothetical protein
MPKTDPDEWEVISAFPLDRAIADGVLVPVFAHRWQELSGGKPIVATSHLYHQQANHTLWQIWVRFCIWRKNVMPTLPDADRMFKTAVSGQTIWVDETPEAITLMYSEDY